MRGASGDPPSAAAAVAVAVAAAASAAKAAAIRALPRYRRHLAERSDSKHSEGADPYLGQHVTVFRNGGWYAGKCSGVFGRRYMVFFSGSGVEMEFHPWELVWPWDKQFLEDKEPEFPAFSEGDEVEVFRNREDYGMAWFGATVVEVIGKTSFRVEYDRLVTGGGRGFLKETVHALYMRPVKKFGVLEEVEACCYGGWTAGVVSRILSPSKYTIRLKHLGEEEMVFHCSDLRPRWEWMLGAWSPASLNVEKESLGRNVNSVDRDSIYTNLRVNRKKNKVLEEIEEQCFELNKRLKTMERFEIAEDAQVEEEKEEEEESSSKKNLVWTIEMDRRLIAALVEQMHEGNKVGKSFTNRGYIAACDEIYVKFGKKVTVGHLKNRLKTLKKDLTAFEDMESSGCGFSFNKITKMMDAEPTVWVAYIEAHPEAKQYRCKPVPCFENLRILFGKDQEIGHTSETAKEKHLRPDDLDELNGNNHNTLQETEAELHLESGGESINTSRLKQTSKGPLCKSLSYASSRRDRGPVDDLKEISTLTCGINAVASAIKRCAPRTITEDQLFEELQKIRGLDEEFQLRAYDYLCGDVTRGRTFVGLPIDRRRRWLELKLDGISE